MNEKQWCLVYSDCVICLTFVASAHIRKNMESVLEVGAATRQVGPGGGVGILHISEVYRWRLKSVSKKICTGTNLEFSEHFVPGILVVLKNI
jgi:hypothetical protein